jgi:hypothetical protein
MEVLEASRTTITSAKHDIPFGYYFSSKAGGFRATFERKL